mgnify:CR=1 FL=1
MVTGVATGDVMVAVVIGEHHERFAGLHQCFGILHGVAEVDVVVGRAVANQELAIATCRLGVIGPRAYPAAFSFGVRMKRSV